jgi:hypothetical protein
VIFLSAFIYKHKTHESQIENLKVRNQDIAYPDTYKEICKKEITMSFPLESVSYAKVSDMAGLNSKRLKTKELNDLILILNDTGSYEWGEIGTFEPTHKILFFNQKDEVIGITKIEIDRYFVQTQSNPHLGKMKWGALSKEGQHQLKYLIGLAY